MTKMECKQRLGAEDKQKIHDHIFFEADKNKDKKISFAEFQAKRQEFDMKKYCHKQKCPIHQLSMANKNTKPESHK